jgi:hypothetical protein
MSRIRTIKPDFWRNEDLSSVSAEAALLAVGLLNFADDEGFFQANPRLIQADIFPLRELSGSPTLLLNELSKIGFVRLFSGLDGKQYGEIVNFLKHQVINKPTPSKFKGLETIPEDYGSDPVALPSGKERKGKEMEGEKEVEGKGTGEGKTTSAVILPADPTEDPPDDSQKRATRIDPSLQLSADWLNFAKAERPDLDPNRTFSMFRDYWLAKSGKDATKLDWFATWRNWVRGQKADPKAPIDFREARAQRAVDEFVFGSTPGRIIDVN